MKKREGKKAQVTLFLILGILIVSSIFIYFLWIQPTFIIRSPTSLGFEGCINQYIGDYVNELSLNGGYLEPVFSYKYNNIDYPYFCYTNEHYVPCMVYNPFILKNFEDNLKIKLSPKVQECYDYSIQDLKSKGFDVKEGNVDFDLFIKPFSIEVEVKAPITVDNSLSYQDFLITQPSNLESLLYLASQIVYMEVEGSDVDTSVLNYLNPKLNFKLFKTFDETTLYTIEDKQSKTKFKFATRSYVFPAGYFGEI
ncbi:MAG: hypothetical protein WC260_00015 [Candidatus Pacearchaeota archaeon]